MNFSKFLPSEFSKSSKLAIIAGRGEYPKILYDRIKKCEIDPYLIALDTETDEIITKNASPNKTIVINIGQIGKLLSFIRGNNIDCVLMAGQVQPRKLFHGLRPDIKALFLLSKLKTKNAATIFGAISDELANVGASVLDSRCFMEEDLATAGNMTEKKVQIKQEYIDHGVTVTKAIADLDVGQSAIFRKGTVLAVEDFAGTNDLIRRAGSFKTDEAFLVKVSKGDQNFRFDVPIFGQQTLDVMIENNIKTAVLECDSVIILNKKLVLDSANENNIKIFGFK